MKRYIRTLLGVAVLMAMVAGDARAQTQPDDLALASLEDLLKIEITIASHTKQEFDMIPAAVFVLTPQDIRRSGATTLPDALRLIPGVSVSQIASNFWAISIRGLTGVLSNKLLVLVDGRTIYNATFAGVNWSVEGVFLDDVKRIEVIRGPGGAVWGANAVNGVINIITKSASDSQGGLINVGAGEGGRAAFRYGGALGAAAYRVYVQSVKHSPLEIAGASAQDGWRHILTGGRLDWSGGRDRLTAQSSYGRADTKNLQASGPPIAFSHVKYQSGNGNLAWTRTQSDRSALEVTSFVNVIQNDLVNYGLFGNGSNHEFSADVGANYHTQLSARHVVAFGGGFRHRHSTAFMNRDSPPTTEIDGQSRLVSLFAQDEIALAKRLSLTLASRWEHDSPTGWTAQPTGRVMWDLGRAQQRLWFATSHAVRTPSATDIGLNLEKNLPPIEGLPVVLITKPNPNYLPERFSDVEAGYRMSAASSLTFDITAFRGRYKDLPLTRNPAPTFVAVPPHLVVRTETVNGLQIATHGVEGAWKWKPANRFGVDGSYSWIRQESKRDPASLDAENAVGDLPAPTHQWQFHPWVLLGRTELSGSVFRIGQTEKLALPAHTRLDAKIGRSVGRDLNVSLVGQNLLGAHVEASNESVVPFTAEVPRRVMVQMDWRFAQ